MLACAAIIQPRKPVQPENVALPLDHIRTATRASHQNVRRRMIWNKRPDSGAQHSG
jgi:hypothetical protein